MMDVSQAEAVLSTLSEVYALDDVQEIVDLICQRVVKLGPYRTALLSLYFEEDVYVGLEGGEEKMRRSFLESARRATSEGRAIRRKLIWQKHRIRDTNICFIPEESDIPYGASFHPCEDVPGAEWRPNDRMMVFVRGADKEVRGVLALDRPVDGKRPDVDSLGPLRAIDRFIALMGVVIHNKYLASNLRESEERYAAVVEQGHDGILIAREGKILFANRRLGEMIGVAPRLLVGRRVDKVISQDVGTTLPGEKDGHLVRTDGRAVDVALHTSKIRVGGEGATLIAVADITERKRILAQLVRTQKMESVATLASGVAHDFNNLLGGILGYASLLKTCLGDEERSERYIRSIEKAADRAADVTRQLLGIVRDEEVRVAAFPVVRVLGEVAGLLEETLDPSITVTVRCDQDLIRVLGDESQVHQVLLNVCLNARDAMPDGGTLSLEAHETQLEGLPAARIVVRDTGSGMDTETLDKVFDPFFTTKEGGRGTGLGLYMAYRVIERHGGTIDIFSRPGGGTAVEIVLPASQAVAEKPTARLTEDAPAPGGTILLVDDEEVMREVGAEMLRGLGYDVVTAADGRRAVNAVRSAREDFRCVVLDIAMPVMNGWEAAKTIRELKPDLPILLSSGHDLDATKGDTHGLDVARCLKKPYRIENLREALREVLQGTRARS
ncbi:MAG: hybrid sensor histidine kinase/response regulator [Planctomycetota bacterium]|jgi:PAS domain S-box-containing protein